MPTLHVFTNDLSKYKGGGSSGSKSKKKGSAKQRWKLKRKPPSKKKPIYSNADNAIPQTFFANQAYYKQVNGKNYLIVPGIPVQEQVMNTYLLPAEEIQKSLESWNGTPLSIRHAQKNGGSVQVDEPDVPIIGQFQNATWDAKNNRMMGEYWIDLSVAMNYPDGYSIVSAIQQGKILETSTAYWADEEWKSGTFRNKTYTSIHRNPKRDHIAIFPDQQLGACSINDGCGVNRNMQQNCDCIHHNVTGSLSGSGKALWEKVYNDNKDKGEESAAKIAWAAVKQAGWHKGKNDEWVKKNNQDYPEYKPNHLPTVMLIGYALNKGYRMKDQLDGARARAEKNGITKPIWVQCYNDDGYRIRILDGNHRVHLADELNIEQIPVRVVNKDLMELDPEAVYREWLHEQDQGYLS